MSVRHQNYFAYGSNLPSLRLKLRCPSAEPIAVGLLNDYRLQFDMRSLVDGSAKANIAPLRGAHLFGVVYHIAAEDWPALDRAEGGYRRIQVTIHTQYGEIPAQTYMALRWRITRQRRPYSWYLSLMRHGAREHQLPLRWRLKLGRPRYQIDPLSRRRSKFRILLANMQLKFN